jgi:flagellar motor protein MotB
MLSLLFSSSQGHCVVVPRRRCRRVAAALLGWSGILLAAGCNQSNPLIANRPAGWPTGPQSPQVAYNPAAEADRRAHLLDADNRDLHSELAKSQQQVQLLNDKIALLSKQLADTASLVKSEQLAKQEAERRAEMIQTSTRLRGGATITANNSLNRSLEMISIPGVEVRRDNDVIRIELPSDRLFSAGTAQLQGTAQLVLDQVADAVTRSYPRQMLGIEAHTDANPAGAALTQQLAAAQAVAVFQSFTTRNRIPANQLFTVAHGSNHPLASNATPAGRAKNRRIEVVIYPEVVGQR